MRGPGNKYANVPPLAVNSFIHRDYVDTVGHYIIRHDNNDMKFNDVVMMNTWNMLDAEVYPRKSFRL